LVMSGYGLLVVLAKTTLGGCSDRFGRKPILAIGLIVHTAQYVALIATDSPAWIALGIAGSGLGEGLFMPALNATFLDITPEQYRARVIGFKESMFSLGGLVGPVLIVAAVQYLQPVPIFVISGALILLSACLVPFLPLRARIEWPTKDALPKQSAATQIRGDAKARSKTHSIRRNASNAQDAAEHSGAA
jgi:MFS family permease